MHGIDGTEAALAHSWNTFTGFGRPQKKSYSNSKYIIAISN
jgi:hypothetical protein